MAASQLLEKCCKHHIDARLKSYAVEISFSIVTSRELTSEERDCLYACNGYYFQCPRYMSTKEVMEIRNDR
jgi:hypothetical protein